MPEIQFAINSYQARALPISAQQCVNYFVEQLPPDAKSPVVLYNTPGLKSFVTAGPGPIRGMHRMQGEAYVVSGPGLYGLTAGGTAAQLGSIAGVGPVSMASNDADQLCVVNGLQGYIYDLSTGFAQISDPDFLAASAVTHQDGYFIFTHTDTAQFFISNLLNGLAYLATDIATAEGADDKLVAVKSNHREVWLFGEETIEIWFNSGNLDFPFDRLGGTFIERGCGAAHSIARFDNTLVWLGEDLIVYRANGYQPERISTHAIEEEIRKYATTSDAIAFTYTDSGHKFYCLTFPSALATWVYDAATRLWHERDSRDSQGISIGRWRANAYVRAYGKHLIGDYATGQIGELDMDTFVEYSNVLQALATGPSMAYDRKRVIHRRFELDVESGVGTTSGQGSDPEIVLDYSDDGGRTFSTRKPPRSIGKQGEYKKRLRWNRMGQSRNRIYRVVTSDPVKRSIVAAHVELGLGAS